MQKRKHLMREEEKIQEQEQNSNVMVGEKVGTTEENKGNRCLEKINKVYHDDGVRGDQNVENEAADYCTEESKVKMYDKRDKGQISEPCSSEKDKEEQNIHDIEISRAEEPNRDRKAEKDEKLKESIVEKDASRPDHLAQGIESKHANYEEDEDIMQEIEEQLKDISVARI